MERILSKEEISELLASIKGGEISLDDESSESLATARGPAEKFDLFHNRPSVFELENFDLFLDGFARNCSITLTNHMQRSVTVKRTTIETMDFENFVAQIQPFTAISLIRMDPLRWGGLITLENRIAFPMVEILLGAMDEQRLIVPNRAFSTIELGILKGVIKDTCADLHKALLPIEDLDINLVKMENDPRLVSVVPPEAQIVKCHFRINLSQLSGKMTLMIPRLSLEPLRDKFRANSSAHNQSGVWKKHLMGELMRSKVSLEAQLGTMPFTVREILNFQVGDIIEMEDIKDNQLKVLVEGQTKFLGVAGVRNGKKAVRLTERYRKEQGNE